MVQLLTLSGDSEVSNTELKATSHQPISIAPYSRVGLAGINVNLADDIANESFRVTSNNNTFTIGSQTSTPTATLITSAGYSANQFLNEVQNAANFTGTADASLLGRDYTVAVNSDGKFELTASLDPKTSANFNEWSPVSGTPVLAGTNNFTADAAEETIILSNRNAPRVSNTFTAVLNNPATVNIEIVMAHEGEDIFGIRAEGTVYQYKTAAGAWTAFPGPVGAVNNDQIGMSSHGAKVVFTIADSTGTPKVGSPYTFTDQTRALLDNTNPYYQITAAATAVLTLGRCTQMGASVPTPDVTTVFTLGSKELASYLGFVNTVAHTFEGDPGVLVSHHKMLGLIKYPGIMVTLNGLGVLKSYNLARTKRSNNIANILHTIHDNVDSGAVIAKDINPTYFLDIGNANPMSVNQLQARLYGGESDDGTTQNVLNFVGYPSITILIEEPNKPSDSAQMTRANFPI